MSFLNLISSGGWGGITASRFHSDWKWVGASGTSGAHKVDRSGRVRGFGWVYLGFIRGCNVIWSLFYFFKKAWQMCWSAVIQWRGSRFLIALIKLLGWIGSLPLSGADVLLYRQRGRGCCCVYFFILLRCNFCPALDYYYNFFLIELSFRAMLFWW